MSAKAKKPSIRRVRVVLNSIIIVLITLAGRFFYDQWQNKNTGTEIIYRCELPEVPAALLIANAQLDEPHVYLSVTAHGDDSEVFDEWMAKVDEWRAHQPFSVLNASFRESEKSLRLDFTAELRIAPEENH